MSNIVVTVVTSFIMGFCFPLGVFAFFVGCREVIKMLLDHTVFRNGDASSLFSSQAWANIAVIVIAAAIMLFPSVRASMMSHRQMMLNFFSIYGIVAMLGVIYTYDVVIG